MHTITKEIQILSAPSILGLKPTGVEHLGESLLSSGLADKLNCSNSVINVPVKNSHYSFERDSETGCLNPSLILDFSLLLMEQITQQLDKDNFPLVLGGDCSVLLGIMPALKLQGTYGIFFLDAHADFYEPSKSTTGEVADMDLAIITGRGPEVLTNINGLKPYVSDEHVIHIGQRDAEETKKYNSQDIAATSIKRFDLEYIRANGLSTVIKEMLNYIDELQIEGFWIHFDTDVLSDDENPAVDYRLPGGITVEEAQLLLSALLATQKSVGMSVTIYNPHLDTSGNSARLISSCLSKAFDRNSD